MPGSGALARDGCGSFVDSRRQAFRSRSNASIPPSTRSSPPERSHRNARRPLRADRRGLWVPEGQDDGYLLFSDNAANVIYKWTAEPAAVGIPGAQRLYRHATTPRSARRPSPAGSRFC